MHEHVERVCGDRRAVIGYTGMYDGLFTACTLDSDHPDDHAHVTATGVVAVTWPRVRPGCPARTLDGSPACTLDRHHATDEHVYRTPSGQTVHWKTLR